MRAMKARYRESCKVKSVDMRRWKSVEMRATTLELRQKERCIELMTCSESNMLARHNLSYKLMSCDRRISSELRGLRGEWYNHVEHLTYVEVRMEMKEHMIVIWLWCELLHNNVYELSLIESPAIRSQVIMCEAGTRTLRWSKMFSEYELHFMLMRLIMVRPSGTA